MAAMMTVFSYGQAGGVVTEDDNSVIFQLNCDNPFYLVGDVYPETGVEGAAFDGVYGLAMNATYVQAWFESGSNFGIVTEDSFAEDGSVTYYQQYSVQLEEGSFAFYFAIGCHAYEAGTYSDVLHLESNGVTYDIQLYGMLNGGEVVIEPNDSTPYLYLDQHTLTLETTPAESGTARVIENLWGYANAISTVHAQITSGSTNFAFYSESAAGVVVGSDGGVTYLTEMDVTVDPDGYFSVPVVFFASEIGEYMGQLKLTAAGVEDTYVVLEGKINDYIWVTEPYLEVNTDYLVIRGTAGQPTTESVEITVANVEQLTLTMMNGSNFGIIDYGEDGSMVIKSSKTYAVSGGSTIGVNIAIFGSEAGTYSDVLQINADGLSRTVTLEGSLQAVVVEDPYLTWNGMEGTEFYLSRLLAKMQGQPSRNFHDTVWRAYFGVFYADSVIAELKEHTDMILCPSSWPYDPSSNHLYVEGNNYPDCCSARTIGVKITNYEPGEYIDTLIFKLYGASEVWYKFPIQFTVVNDTLPMMRVNDDEISLEIDKGAAWSSCYSTLYVYPERVDSVFFRLADGSHFRLLDMFSSGGRIRELDSALLLTEQVFGPEYESWYGSYLPVYPFLLADEAGIFTDTLIINAKGIDETFKVVLRGKVTDWFASELIWQDKDVIITLREDSLIISGSGSTSDYDYYVSSYGGYYTYRYPQWYNDIVNHRGYEYLPKHIKVLPGVSRLGNYAFYSVQFVSIELGEIDSLGFNVFNYTYQMESLELPASLKYIGCDAFYSYGMNVKTIINNLPPDVEMCGNPFNNLYYTTKVIANTTQLLEINNPSEILVVPATPEIRDIYVAYGYAYDEPETGYDIVAGTYLTLDAAAVSDLPTKPSMILDYSKYNADYCGHVSMPIDAALDMSRFVKKDYIGKLSPFSAFDEEVRYGPENVSFRPGHVGVNTTLINEGTMSADTVELRESLTTDRWAFMGLPFNQKVSEIGMPAGTYYSIRRFNAATQAEGDYNNVWDEVAEEDTLHAGEPFIIQITNYQHIPAELSFRAIDDAAKQGIFSQAQATLRLQQTPAEMVWDANWNYLVNPYPCFYDTRAIGNSGVITVYGNQDDYTPYYHSYSLQDDYYVLQSHEAFFYQAAAGETALRMPLEGKQHTAEAEGIEYTEGEYYYEDHPQAPSRGNRVLFNFFLAQNNNEDRARVVINDAASMDYEVGVDALKMFAPGSTAAQFFAEQGGAQQSILERPLGNGIVYLGARLMESGDCTLSIPENHGVSINLYDTETGVMTNLSENNYTFYGTPGEYSQRFLIGISASPTALEDFISGLTEDGVKKVIENGHVFILRGSDKFDVLGNKH